MTDLPHIIPSNLLGNAGYTFRSEQYNLFMRASHKLFDFTDIVDERAVIDFHPMVPTMEV